jgi:hypothetical protein
MANLAAMGITVVRRFLSETGEETSADEVVLTELAFTLPKPMAIQATFAHEGLGEKLVKIFRKEIQTGDPLFDEAVHIKTETTGATTALLESTDVRAIIERVIVNGGAIEIDGAFVKMEIAGRHEPDDEVVEHFLRVLVGNG